MNKQANNTNTNTNTNTNMNDLDLNFLTIKEGATLIPQDIAIDVTRFTTRLYWAIANFDLDTCESFRHCDIPFWDDLTEVMQDALGEMLRDASEAWLYD